MENEQLIQEVTAKAQKWLTPAYDAETQAEVRRMLESEDKTDLIEAFYKDLEFGTGGLRVQAHAHFAAYVSGDLFFHLLMDFDDRRPRQDVMELTHQQIFPHCFKGTS